MSESEEMEKELTEKNTTRVENVNINMNKCFEYMKLNSSKKYCFFEYLENSFVF